MDLHLNMKTKKTGVERVIAQKLVNHSHQQIEDVYDYFIT